MPGPFSFDDAALTVLVCAVALYTVIRHPQRVVPALKISLDTLNMLLPVVVSAIMAASFLAHLIPRDTLAPLIGPDSGLSGVLLASLVGACIPGGPMITFPLVVAFAQAGAGTAQMIAMISGWSVVAIHRLVSLEAPMMGRQFVVRRLASSFFLPPLSGLIAMALLTLKE